MKRRVKALTVVLAICLITVFIRCQSNETPIQQLVVVVNGDSIEMVFVKGGTFMMGCTDEQGCDCEDNEKPARKESVSDFYIGKYEVTQRLWRAVMDTDSILPFNGGCGDCPDFLIGKLLGEISRKHINFSLLFLSEVFTAARTILLDRVAALLDHLGNHFRDLRIRRLDLFIDFSLLHCGKKETNRAQTVGIMRTHGGLHIFADSLFNHHHP